MTKPKRNLQLESYIEKLIEEEVESALLEEGIADWIKKGVQAATGAWEKIKGRLAGAVNNMKAVLQQKFQQASQAYPQVVQQYQALKALEGQAGEKFPVDNVMKQAQELPAAAKAAIAETQGEKQAVASAAGEVQAAEPTQAQEAYADFTASLLEESVKRYKVAQRKSLKEAKEEERELNELGVTGVVGLGLGVVGGVPLLIKGLYKLAGFFKLTKTADFLKKAYNVAHHIEEKVVDYIIPDRLSYIVYKQWYSAVVKQDRQAIMSFEDYRNSKVRKQVERKVYIVLLLPFLVHGIHGMAHAGLNMLGAAEGAASTVKAVEIGQEVIEVATAIAAAAKGDV